MLQLKNIVKNYSAGDSTVAALRGVSVSFRDREFVAVLGPSGCGKTTLLNIIGGLDQYTSGDLLISGRSATATGTPTATIPSASSTIAITSSRTSPCCKMSSWR